MKFHTAPMRLKRGNDLADLQAQMSGEMSPDAKALTHTYSPSADEDALALLEGGGSWPKVSKRRTSSSSLNEDSMSLREVSEALAASHIASAPAPAPADIGEALNDAFTLDGLDALNALDALVSAELEAEASAKAAEAAARMEDDVCAERFVDAVFGEQELPAAAPPPAVAPRLSADEEALFAMCLPPHAPMTELDGDELLAMLHGPLGALDEPGSPSPHSVTATLFGGDTPPLSLMAAGTRPLDSLAVSQKLEAALDAEGAKQQTSRNAAERKEWTAEEDDIIRESVRLHGCRWRRIAAQLPGRSDDAVRNRYNRLKGEKGDAKERASSPLGGAAEGSPNADGAAAPPPPAAHVKRTTSSDSGVGKTERVSWTRAEDETILQSVQELGHKWNKLAERLPGRTDHAIRNRFHRLQTMFVDKQPPFVPEPHLTLAPYLPLTVS